MALSSILREEADSSEDDYRRKRDKNNQVSDFNTFNMGHSSL